MWPECVSNIGRLIWLCDGLPSLCAKELRGLSDNRTLCNRPFLPGTPPPCSPQLEPDLQQPARFVKAIVGVSRKVLTGFFRANQKIAVTPRPQPSGFAKS